MNIYYVYQYLRKDGSPYYIGKGSGRRAYVKQRAISKPTDNTQIQIIARHLSEPEAFLLETKLVALYGRVDLGNGILHNKTDGGDGGHNVVNKIAWNKGKKQSAEHKMPNPGRNKDEKHCLDRFTEAQAGCSFCKPDDQ